MAKILLLPYKPEWRVYFEAEVPLIRDALGENVVTAHHIGSTSIPGIYAKPVIDILLEVDQLDAVDRRGSEMELLGYEVMGEFGIPRRRYFRKDDREGVRTHQIHTFEKGTDQVIRHLAFRDYLIAHPDEALEYSDLKRRLAAEHANDANAYMDGKDSFIQEIDRRAAVWKRAEEAV